MNQNTQDASRAAASTRTFIPLEAIYVASPCKADWDKMTGDAQARFCQSCEKHVYNLSSMTRREAETLVAEKEGKLCVRFYRREDGTMLTSDCHIGAAALSMRLREAKFSPLRVLAIFACALGALLPNAMHANASGFVDSLRRTPGVGAVVNLVSPQATAGEPAMMGDMAAPPRPKVIPRRVMGRMAVPHMGKVRSANARPKRVVKKQTPKIRVQGRVNVKTLPRRK